MVFNPMKNPITAVILAAGKGTRMKSPLPKILHPLLGRPLVSYSLNLCQKIKVEKILLVTGQPVTGKDNASLKEFLKNSKIKNLDIVVQDPPLGTGHAVMMAAKKLKNFKGNVLIVYGDMPLLTVETIQRLIEEHRTKNSVFTFVTAPLSRFSQAFGRLIRDSQGNPVAIVEVRDANAEELQINETNVGVYFISAPFLCESLKNLAANNSQKEYYLTDLIKIAATQNVTRATISLDNPVETLGVNTQKEMTWASEFLSQRKIEELMQNGVRFVTTQNVVIEPDVSVGADTTIWGPCVLRGKTRIGKNCVIEPHVVITDSIIDDGVTIGPFAHLRPGSVVGPNVKIGNFVETKKSNIKEGAKVNHLSYIGDADIGRHVNIGAGTITCNYDGVNKYKTVLEDNVFVGSDTQFVAPVRVGKGAFIGAGSTITKNVKPGSLALSRALQVEIKNWGRKKKRKD